MNSCWEQAADEADLTVTLPGGVPMFFQRIPRSPPEGFRMGSRGNYHHEEPIHRIVIPEAREFYLGTFVVTQEQYQAVAAQVPALSERAQPSDFKGPRLPVENVDWFEANQFCHWLTCHLPADSLPAQGHNLFCLPTEAEWEYACRAGAETDYHNGDGDAALTEVGWFDANSESRTHPVDERVAGREESHPFKLRGMHGNVWEWCHDLWDSAAYRTRVDGDPDPSWDPRSEDWESRLNRLIVPGDNRSRVIRGGAWCDSARFCRSAFRYRGRPVGRFRLRGFRVCLVRGPAVRGGAQEQNLKAESAAGPEAGRRGTRRKAHGPDADGAGVDLATSHITGAAGRKFFADSEGPQPPGGPPEPTDSKL